MTSYVVVNPDRNGGESITASFNGFGVKFRLQCYGAHSSEFELEATPHQIIEAMTSLIKQEDESQLAEEEENEDYYDHYFGE